MKSVNASCKWLLPTSPSLPRSPWVKARHRGKLDPGWKCSWSGGELQATWHGGIYPPFTGGGANSGGQYNLPQMLLSVSIYTPRT